MFLLVLWFFLGGLALAVFSAPWQHGIFGIFFELREGRSKHPLDYPVKKLAAFRPSHVL